MGARGRFTCFSGGPARPELLGQGIEPPHGFRLLRCQQVRTEGVHDLYGAIVVVQRTLFEGIHVSVQLVPVFRNAPQILQGGPVTLQIISRLEFSSERVAVAGFTS